MPPMTHPGYLATRAQLHAVGLRPGRVPGIAA